VRAPWAAVIAIVAHLAWAGEAGAFCRSRTCDPANPKHECEKDANDCVTTGKKLFWATSCLTFDAQADGSSKRDIDADLLTAVMAQAFATWLRADCGGRAPSLEVGTFGPVECAVPGFKQDARNANIVMFRDDRWPYPGSSDAFALTFVSFNPDTGQIVDADIEINSAEIELTTDGQGAGVDLQAVLTHEAGHFLGLAHAAPENGDATMRARWDGKGTELRTLTLDDQGAMCELFPPDRPARRACEPIHGFGSGCDEPSADPVEEQDSGCSLAVSSRGTSASLLVPALACLIRRRRRPDGRRRGRDASAPKDDLRGGGAADLAAGGK
jgi:hypothetical protein